MKLIKNITEKLNKPKPMDVLYKKGKITFEEAVTSIAVDFASDAFRFYEATMQVGRDVERYNKKKDILVDAINSLSEGTNKESEGLNRMILSTLGRLPEEIREFIEARNSLYIQGGILCLINYTGMCELAGEKMDPEYLIARCLDDDVIKKTNELITLKLAPDEYDYPELDQLRYFWKIVCRCHEAMYVTHTECFDENGLVTGINGGLMEINHLKNLAKVDYKGLI